MLKITNDVQEFQAENECIVYFTAEWCGPCKQLKPQYAKAAVIDKDTTYYIVDVDKINSKYLTEYGIQSIPQIFEMRKCIINKKITGKTSDAILAEMEKK